MGKVDMYLIGVIYSGNKQCGCRIYNDVDGHTVDVTNSQVIHVINTGQKITGLEVNSGELVGTNGALDRYAKIRKINGKEDTENALVVLNVIVKGGKRIGYRFVNGIGKVTKIKREDIERIPDDLRIANGKVLRDSDGELYISAISGTYKEEVVAEAKQREKEAKEELKNRSLTMRNIKIVSGVPSKNSRIHEVDDKTGMTVEQKMVYALFALRSIAPLYYVTLQNLRKIESDEEHGTPTLGVTINALYYNVDFVKELEMHELIFILVHEVSHILGRHHARLEGRNRQLFNIATDLFINKVIQEDFELPLNHKPKEVKGLDSIKSFKVSLPSNVLFDKDTDTKKETPESIYDELIKSMNNNNSAGGQGSGSSDDGDEQGQGQGSGSGDSEDGNSGSGDVDNNEDNNENGNSGSGNCKIAKYRSVRVRVVEGDEGDCDLVDDEESASMTSEQKRNASKSAMVRAVQNMKNQGLKFGGETGMFFEREAARLLAPKIDWRRLLMKYLIAFGSNKTSYCSPDRRFISRGKVLPGPKKSDANTLKNIKICVDTSGSITDEDLGRFFGQMEQLLKTYKAEAELLYWDTEIRATYEFKNVQELAKCKPYGGGGTDVDCVFRYFSENEEYRRGIKAQPSVIIIFTDGCFSPANEKYAKNYKDTIYVISKDGDQNLSVPFGKVAPVSREEG